MTRNNHYFSKYTLAADDKRENMPILVMFSRSGAKMAMAAAIQGRWVVSFDNFPRVRTQGPWYAGFSLCGYFAGVNWRRFVWSWKSNVENRIWQSKRHWSHPHPPPVPLSIPLSSWNASLLIQKPYIATWQCTLLQAILQHQHPMLGPVLMLFALLVP